MKARIERLLDDVAGVVRPIVGARKPTVLAYVARTVVTANRDRAEQFARAIPHDGDRAAALADMAADLAPVDANHAEWLLRGMEMRTVRHSVLALCAVAKAVADANPGRVKRLLKEAEHLAWSGLHRPKGVVVSNAELGTSLRVLPGIHLVDVAKAVAEVGDPGRAKRLLLSVERRAKSRNWEYQMQPDALSLVAIAMVALDPRRAERIAISIQHPGFRASTLLAIAAAMATMDSATADRIARSVPTRVHSTPNPPSAVVVAMAPADRDRAENLARSVPEDDGRGQVLVALAGALAGSDRAHADRLIAEAERMAELKFDEYSQRMTAAAVATAVAATDPDRAERIMRPMVEGHGRSFTLADIAKAMAATDPERAERIIRSMSDAGLREKARADFVTTTAVADPDRAERVARSLTDDYLKACALADVVRGLAR